jgi:hypothetical protein
MKRKLLILSTIFLFLLLAGFQTATAGDRMVLVERFTSWTCPPCASNNPIMDAFLMSQDPEHITGISYHMNWPAPGNDGFYLYNPTDNNTRRTYYGVNSIPQADMDGIINIQPAYNQSTLQGYYDSRKNILSPVTLIVTDSTYGDSLLVRVLLYCEIPLTNSSVTVHVAILEKYKQYSSPPGTNGETVFRDVMRKMLPNGNGTSIVLLAGQTYVYEYRVYMDPVWQANQIVPLAFVQASDKEILNAALNTINFTLLPNTAYKVVNQGQNQNASFKIKVPVVASGYNSAVTLTAAVDPPNSGITITFPSGNTISNFPDSVSMQVSSTAAVPLGAFKIIVTGTNTNGKIHKTTVSYLVGRNYVFVGANRPNLKFKVDSDTFSTKQFFTWDLNSVHTLAAVSPQVFNTIRYVFQSWSNNGDSVQNVTITPAISDYTVNYKIQYKLVTQVQPGGISVNVSGGNNFYDSASIANLSVSPLEVQFNNMTYYFQRWQGGGNGSYTGTNPSPQLTMNNVILETAVYDTIPPIGVTGQSTEIPKVYSLEQNYPNPFNPATTIKFGMPHDGFVTLKIYDVLGNEVYTIDASYRKAGYYEARFDASNWASGVYFYKLETNGFTAAKKMLLVK